VPIFLLPILSGLKQLPWKWILLALAVLIALGSIYHKGYTSGYDASEKAVEARTAASVKAALALQAQRQRTVDTAEEAHRAMLQHTILQAYQGKSLCLPEEPYCSLS
jgi:hypothetical protein